MLLYTHIGYQPRRLTTQRSGNGKLVISQKRCGRFKAGKDLDGRIHTDGDADGQRLPQLLRPICHGPNMTGTGPQENGQFILSLDTHPMDRHIALSRIRVRGIAHAQREILPDVQGRVRGSGDQPAQAKTFLLSQMFLSAQKDARKQSRVLPVSRRFKCP